VKFGVATFITDEGISPRRLGAAVEERGFNSLVVTEHSHIPIAYEEPYPGAGELPRRVRSSAMTVQPGDDDSRHAVTLYPNRAAGVRISSFKSETGSQRSANNGGTLVRETSAGTFPTADNFDKLYRGESSVEGGPKPAGIPWDVHQAQPRLMELEALGGIAGEVLDIGCGLGDNSIFQASRGYSVTGLDGSTAAIEQARSRAAEAGVTVAFGVAVATNLSGYDGRFDTVIDSALYGGCASPRSEFDFVLTPGVFPLQQNSPAIR
jgi:hypothetical protein